MLSLSRLRAGRPRALRRFEALARREDPAAVEVLLALDPVMVLDAAPARYAALLERAVQLAPEAEPRAQVEILLAHARAWTLRGGLRIARGAVAQARALTAESGRGGATALTAARIGLIALHTALGMGARTEVEAETRAFEALARASRREPEALRIAALAEQASGFEAITRGALREAVARFEAAVDLARRAELDRTLAIALANRGHALEKLGEPAEAAAALHQSLVLFAQLGDDFHTSHVEGHLLLNAHRRGAPLDASRALAAADLCEQRGDLRTAVDLLLALVDASPGPVAPAGSTPALARAWALLAKFDAPEREERARRLSEPWSTAPPLVLAVAPDGTFAQLGQRALDLGKRKALPGVLRALVTAAIDHPGQHLDLPALFAAGWPGERALHHAAAARVYMAVRALRGLGLGAVLTSGPAGYRLDPTVQARWI